MSRFDQWKTGDTPPRYEDPPEEPDDTTFANEWCLLAKLGHCDSLGGAEFDRIRREWIENGRPTDVEGFIIQRANVGPPCDEGDRLKYCGFCDSCGKIAILNNWRCSACGNPVPPDPDDDSDADTVPEPTPTVVGDDPNAADLPEPDIGGES